MPSQQPQSSTGDALRRAAIAGIFARDMRKALRNRPCSLAALGILCALVSSCSEVVPAPGSGAAAPADPTDTPGDGRTPPAECGSVNPVGAEARLLTRVEYDNTVRDLLGDTTQPASSFPPENTVEGFGNNARAHQATPLLVEQYMAAAESVAARAVAERLGELTSCDLASIEVNDVDNSCGVDFIDELGSRAFRRPLTDDERQPLVNLLGKSLTNHNAVKAVEHVIQALLQSPQFLYRSVSGAALPEGGAPGVNSVIEGDSVRLGSYEIASRLSYLFWNSMPDDELLAAATTGNLVEPAVIEAQARRLLNDERALSTIEDFHRQWLGLDRFSGLIREVSAGVEAPELATRWRESLERFIAYSYAQQPANVASLLSSPTIFVDQALAPLYGVEPPAAGEWLQVTSETHPGLLTQPGMMALLAHSDQSAPIQRGVFVRERMLCEVLPPPPPDVDQMPPDPDPNATTRERFKQHTADARCAGCHALIDDVGFGFEQYDQLGRFRAQENGRMIDATGEVNSAKDPALAGPFTNAAELIERLAQSEQVRNCIATQWYRYSMGRIETERDLCSLSQVQARFDESGGDLKELLVSMALSDAFRYRPVGAQDPVGGQNP